MLLFDRLASIEHKAPTVAETDGSRAEGVAEDAAAMSDLVQSPRPRLQTALRPSVQALRLRMRQAHRPYQSLVQVSSGV